MNVVFLSPSFPPNWFHFCTALAERDVRVLGVGEAPESELRPELRKALADYCHVPQLADYDAMMRAIGLLIHRHGRIDRIESHNEHWLGLESQLRQDFNVYGQKPADTDVNRSKMGMKEVFVRNGIPCARGERVNTSTQVREFVELVGYPVVFKPDIGVGATRTFRVSDVHQLEEALRQIPPGYVVEEFIQGELVSFDGLVDRDGVVVFFTAHEYSAGIMDVVNQQLQLHYTSMREVPKDLELLGRRIVTAFDIRERFFHIELFRLADGSYRPIEVNLRPPGGYTLDMMNYAANVDLYQVWAQLVTGEDLSRWRYELEYHVASASRRFGRRYRWEHDALVKELGDLLLGHGPVPPVFSAAMGDYYYLLRHPDRAPLDEAIVKVEQID